MVGQASSLSNGRNGFLVTGEPAEISKLQCIVAQLNDYPWTTLTTLAA